MTAVKRMVLLAACALAPACASSGTNATAENRESPTVVVDNQSVVDMTIYVLRGGQRIRLGMAGGLRKTKFTIPQGIVFGPTPVRFLADPIGSSRAPISEEITVSQGEEIGLQIPPR